MKLPPTARLVLLVLLSLRFCAEARGAAGDVDLSFDPGSGLNGAIYASALQADGKIIVGGAYMTRVKSVACQNIARLYPDGSGDPGFDAGWLTGFGFISVLALQPDGYVLVGFNGGISRLNPDGSPDANFVPPLVTDYDGFLSGVRAIAVEPDRRILIGGGYSGAENEEYLSGQIRLNTDGSLDQRFQPGGGHHGVLSLALEPDGDILVGGYFLAAQGVFRQHVARLHGDPAPPALSIARSGSQMILSCPTTGREMHLQEANDLAGTHLWSPTGYPVIEFMGRCSVSVPIDVRRKFFRLQEQ